MYRGKKERLYVRTLLPEPALSYPTHYLLGQKLLKDENLHQAIINLHSFNFDDYMIPVDFDMIFNHLHRGYYVIFKESYIVSFMGGKMMYLEPAGWKKLPATEEVFKLENWLVPE